MYLYMEIHGKKEGKETLEAAAAGYIWGWVQVGQSALHFASVFLHCHFDWNILVHRLHHFRNQLKQKLKNPERDLKIYSITENRDIQENPSQGTTLLSHAVRSPIEEWKGKTRMHVKHSPEETCLYSLCTRQIQQLPNSRRDIL